MFVDNKSMCSVNLTSSIKSGARIFLPATKRTPKAREAYAAGLSKQFQTLLLKNNEERITIKDYKDYISQIVKPNIVNIRFIKEDTDGINASISPDIKLYRWKEKPNDYFADYVGFRMSVRKNKDKLDCSQSTLVHETRHLFDMLCNPKYKMARQYKDFDNDELMHHYLEIKNFISTPDLYKPKRFLGIKIPSFEKQLRAKLEGLKNTEVIDILQISRYHLKSEKNAYADSAKFEFNKYPFSMDVLLAYSKLRKDIKARFQFSEKEFTLKKLIREYVSKERATSKLS